MDKTELTIVKTDSHEYHLDTTYGVMRGLASSAFDDMTDDQINALKANLAAAGTSLAEGVGAEAMIEMSADDFRALTKSGQDSGPKMVAHCLRLIDGNPAGETYDDRWERIMSLDWDDVMEMTGLLQGKLNRANRVRVSAQGKSELPSNTGPKKEAKGVPPPSA